MVKLAVAIMTHPSRGDSASQLCHRLTADPYPPGDIHGPHIVIDPEPDGPPSSWRTAKAAWKLMAASEATHHLLLQDDIRVCRDFLLACLRLARRKPDVSIGLYANRKAVDDARQANLAWARIPDGIWGQAQWLPAPRTRQMLTWQDQPGSHSQRYSQPVASFPEGWDDRRIIAYLDEHQLGPVWCTVPSLVEHDQPSNSLLGHSNKSRVARWYIGDDNSALDIDWTRQ